MNYWRHIVPFTVSIFLSQLLYAQPILTPDYNPILNTSRYYCTQDTTGISEGSSGSNITWNFSTLVTNVDGYNVLYRSPAGTIFENNYPESNYYLVDSMDNISSYLEINNDSVFLNGKINPFAETKWKYTNTELLRTFPFSFNETFQDTFIAIQTHADFGHSGEPAFRNGNVSVTYDGYGTLILPNGVFFDSVIRIKTIESYHDSICIFCGIGIDRIDDVVRTNYSWFVDSIKNIILEYEEIDITINGSIKNYKKEIKLYDEETGVYFPIESGIDHTILIYPNPTSNDLYIMNNSEVQSITLISAQGEELLRNTYDDYGNTPFRLDMSIYINGVYFLKIKYSDGSLRYRKVVKQ